MFSDWISIPTLACSALSAVATGTVIMMWIQSSNEKKWSFRYMLIMNLTVAEFLNSWNNTLSGFAVVSSRQGVQPGFSCDLNGWVGQVSVQAADFSVLAIALVTLLTVHFNAWVMKSTRFQQYLLCALVWVIPIVTGTVALATNNIEPVTGNWCWISPKPPYLRYVLGHGWRFVIFIIVIASYTSIFATVRYRLAQRNKTPALNPHYSFSMYTASVSDGNVSISHDDLLGGSKMMPTRAVSRNNSLRSMETGIEAAQDARQAAQVRLGIKPRVRVLPSSELDRDMKHWLMMSLFPLAYILVWLPGIANRMAELLGYQVDALTAMQASTQLTGLVDALVYGFREHRELHRNKIVAREMRHANKSMEGDV